MLPHKTGTLSTEKGNEGCTDTTPQKPKGAPCMLTLSRKQMTVLFLILVSFIVAMAASTAILHATHPELWEKVLKFVPDVVSHM
jgi:hypothetical protein